jgi:hypothetical protein
LKTRLEIEDLKKLADNVVFLQKVKNLALAHKDVAVPSDPDLYSAKMWFYGVIMALGNEGFDFEKVK